MSISLEKLCGFVSPLQPTVPVFPFIQTPSVPTAALGFLTETGKTRASIILSTGTESSFQVTQIRIKVCSCWELLK